MVSDIETGIPLKDDLKAALDQETVKQKKFLDTNISALMAINVTNRKEKGFGLLRVVARELFADEEKKLGPELFGIYMSASFDLCIYDNFLISFIPATSFATPPDLNHSWILQYRNEPNQFFFEINLSRDARMLPTTFRTFVIKDNQTKTVVRN